MTPAAGGPWAASAAGITSLQRAVDPVQQIRIDEILRSPFNRDRAAERKTEQWKEFVDSVRTHGILQPLLARPLPSALDAGRKPGTPAYELVIGEGRWLAADEAGHKTVPVSVKQLTDREVIEVQTIENEKRKDLSPIEQAEKYSQLLNQYKKDGLVAEKAIAQLCKQLSKGKSTVYEALRLLNLPAEAKAAVKSGALPISHAGLLLKLEKFPDAQRQVTAEILKPDRHSQTEGENKVLAYRVTKQRIAEVEAEGERRQEWDRRIKKHKDFLFEEQCHKVMPYDNDYVQESSGFVGKGSWSARYQGYFGPMMKGKKVPKVKTFLAHSRNFSSIVEVWPEKEALAAIAKSGRKVVSNRTGSGVSAAEEARHKAKEAVKRKKAGERRALVGAIVEAAKTATVKVTDFLPFVLTAMHQRALSDSIREMFNRRKLDRKNYKSNGYSSPHTVWFKRELAAANTAGAQLALIVDLAISMDLSAWGGPGGDQVLGQAARLVHVNPKKVLVTAEKAKKEKKVQASGKKSGLSAAGRKKLGALMKARWSARQKKGKKK